MCLYYAGDLPALSLKYFEIIKWVSDAEERENKLSIVESIAPKWEKVSAIFNFESELIKNPGSGTTPEQCLRKVLRKWQENQDKDYPFNWNGLLQLLEDIEHVGFAKQLREALASQRSTVCGNLHNYYHFDQTRISADNNRGIFCLVCITL